MISNPEGNNPFNYPDRAIRRRADVLRGEVEQKYITQAEADAANNEPLPKYPPPAEQRPRSLLVSEVQDRLLADTRLGNTPKERLDKLLKGGLKIYTTFDHALQNMAVSATNDDKPASPSGDDWISSLVAIEPSTGAVKAMVGGTDFATSQYNVATHTPGRQPGSTWKVITLAAALQAGYSPNDLIDGTDPCAVPSQFPAVPPDQLPTNSDGDEDGIINLWQATAGSVNCAFVRLSTSVGQDNLIALAHRMGIEQPTLQRLLNLSIGTIEATPLEMATVMATIANNGLHHRPYVVSKVVNPDGTVLIDDDQRARRPGHQPRRRPVRAGRAASRGDRARTPHGEQRRGRRGDGVRQDRYDRPAVQRLVHRRGALVGERRCGSATSPRTPKVPASAVTRRRPSSGRS